MTALQLPPNTRIGWAPNSPVQAAFLACPVFECLLWGNRGGGKTDALLMAFAQHVGRGFGQHWRGVIFREQFKDLITDLIPKSHQWFKQIFPDAQYVGGNTPQWRFKTGETLMFRHGKDETDYWDYHGSSIPFLGFEELTAWANLKFYLMMFSVCRSSVPDIPRMVRSTSNPYGVGHNVVKRRFIDAAPPGVLIPGEEGGRERVHLQLMMEQNPAIMEGDPEYVKTIKGTKDPVLRKAWLYGSWDIVAGGMFDDLWTPEVHVVAPFRIPSSWRIDRSFDWGESKPFAVQWWAESDGSSPNRDRRAEDYAPLVPKGTLFLIGQWYGSNGEPNEGCRLPAAEVARGILKRESDMGLRGRVQPGPADSSIFNPDHNVDSIGATMERAGVRWIEADKRPNSRVNGWQLFRQRLAASLPRRLPDGKPDPTWVMEEPGIFIFNTCREFLRTVPVLPRDQNKPEDVDTDAEDHDGDGMRYRLLKTHRPAKTTYVPGMF